MRQIFLANPKGGCGKTMISIHLATYFAHQGQSVAICDHDPGQSAMDWLKSRADHLPAIRGIEFFKHGILTNRFDVVIHDMPAACGVNELSSQVMGHQLLIPVLPSATDIKASTRFLMALNRANLVTENPNRIALVANRISVVTNYFKILLTFLNQVNLPMVGYLRDTQNYVHTIGRGRSIFDSQALKFSADQAQWQSIFDWLETTKLKADHPFYQKVEQILAEPESSPVKSLLQEA